MINITKHATERYAKRIKLIPKEDVKSYVALNKDIIVSDLNKMYKYAKFIYQAKFNNHNDANYYLADDIILVIDKDKTALITLYRADYGFDKDINKIIVDRCLEHLSEAEDEYIKVMEDIETKKNDINVEISQIKDKILEYENLIKKYKNEYESLKARLKTVGTEEEEAKVGKDEAARKIIFSVDYKLAIEDIKVV